MADERRLQAQLQAYHREDAGIEFWRALDYKTLSEPMNPPEFDELPESARQPLREAYLLYRDDALRIYHLHLRTARRSRLRRMLESLMRRYPQYTYLFTARTDDSPYLLFIQPRPVLTESERYTIAIRTLEVQPDAPLRTDLEILAQLENDPQANRYEHADRVVEAFSVERVTERFYKDFRRLFEAAESRITGIADAEAKRLFTLKLFNRLLFVRFLERKGWLRFDKRCDYLRALGQDYQANRADSDTFYASRLKPLFFSALNNPQERNLMAVNQGGLLRDLIGDAPYLNGGLFEQRAEDADAHVPDDALQPVLEDLLYRYNFTITESTPLEIEVAVDPEMLGKVFEELVTGRHESGSYYTPRPVVAFMCREALKGYLQSATREPAEAIASFVDAHNASELKDPERVLDALRSVRVCDPACGSGAYLLGMLHELLELRAALFDQKRLDNATLYQRKLEIIQRNLYGVDIDPFAVEIARLRLWLSLVVDDTRNPLDDPDIDVALPNLDFKIEVGDSLLAPDPQGGEQPDLFRQQQIEQYEQLKAEYLRAHSDEQKRVLRQQIEQLREEIRQWAHPDGTIEGFDWRVEFAEVFKDGGFDIVLMNPPYIAANRVPGSHREMFRRYMEALKHRYSFANDLYVHFLVRALQILKEDGHIYAITSDTYLTNVTKENIRKQLLQFAVKLIMPMHPDVFRANVYSCILGLQKRHADSNDVIVYCNARGIPIEHLENMLIDNNNTYRITIEAYKQAFRNLFFLPTESNKRLFCEVLPAKDIIHLGDRRYAPLEIVAPALDTGIHSGNVRHKLFFSQLPSGRQLPKLIQGTQVVRYWTVWDHPDARYRYVDVDYVPDSGQKGIGRGGKPSGRGEYWHWCGDMENHHVEERLLMRQTEDEPFVGYIYQGRERIYTDNTVHTLIITDKGKQLGISYAYLLAILNSASIRTIYRAITQEEGRTLAQVKTTIVNRLPIAIPTAEERAHLEQIVESIWDIYKNHPFPLPAPKQQEIEELQGKIDDKAYDLYRPLLE